MKLQDTLLAVGANQVHLTESNVDSKTSVILWCGLGSTSLSFLHLMCQSAAEKVNIIAIDPPGHGQSPTWCGRFSKDAVTAIWSTVLAHARQQGALHLLMGGHSYGVYTALMALPSLDDQVEGIILLDGGYMDPSPNYDREEALQSAQDFLRSQRYDTWEAYLDGEREMARSWDDEIETMLRSNMKEDNGLIVPCVSLQGAMQATDVLAEFHMNELQSSALPILLVLATEPKELQQARDTGIKQLQTKMTNLKVVTIQGGHDVFVDNPHDTTVAVWEFVRSLRSSRVHV